MFRRLMEAYGYLRSHQEGGCVDKDGKPVPWITYPALEYLSQFDFSQNTVFEWGSGNSSRWLASRFKSVTSVESSRQWFEQGKKHVARNQTLILRQLNPKGSEHDRAVHRYADVILESEGPFDVIFIDGKVITRPRCTDNAITRLSPGGLIVFDNSDWFPTQCQKLRNAGFFEIDFHGPGPLNRYTWTTSLFFEPRQDSILMRNKQAFTRLSKLGIRTHPDLKGVANP